MSGIEQFIIDNIDDIYEAYRDWDEPKADELAGLVRDAQNEESESGLVAFARYELALAGLFDDDSDYNGMLGNAALDIVRVFASQGHSGYSAAITADIAVRLMRYEPLTALTFEPDEWNDVSDMSGTPMWQNRRRSTTFSTDGGRTYYDIDEEGRPIHEGFTS